MSRHVYRLGQRRLSRKRLYVTLLVFLLLVGAAAAIAKLYLKPQASISKKPDPVVSHVSYAAQTVTYNTPLFSISVPKDFKQVTSNTDTPVPNYIWQGTTKDNQARWVDVYVDKSVPELAVNRVIQVQAGGATLNVLGDVSDNCVSFTDGADAHPHTISAKWQGLSFLCDSGNYERDVVGVVSPDGLNTVALTTREGATHHIFITYTDNSPQADYTIFKAALQSFKMN
jgi:hypothetical protein